MEAIDKISRELDDLWNRQYKLYDELWILQEKLYEWGYGYYGPYGAEGTAGFCMEYGADGECLEWDDMGHMGDGEHSQ